MSAELPVLDCRDCGVCCFHMAYPAFNFSEEEQLSDQLVDLEGTPELENLSVENRDRLRWRALPANLKLEIQDAIKNYRATAKRQLDPPCIWLDPETKLCRNHEHRPEVCRDFAVGGRGCLEWRKHYRIDQGGSEIPSTRPAKKFNLNDESGV